MKKLTMILVLLCMYSFAAFTIENKPVITSDKYQKLKQDVDSIVTELIETDTLYQDIILQLVKSNKNIIDENKIMIDILYSNQLINYETYKKSIILNNSDIDLLTLHLKNGKLLLQRQLINFINLKLYIEKYCENKIEE